MHVIVIRYKCFIHVNKTKYKNACVLQHIVKHVLAYDVRFTYVAAQVGFFVSLDVLPSEKLPSQCVAGLEICKNATPRK